MKFRNYKGIETEAPSDLPVIVCSVDKGAIVWSRNGPIHQVRYCLQVYTSINATDAAKQFGNCVHHNADCEGKLEDA